MGIRKKSTTFAPKNRKQQAMNRRQIIFAALAITLATPSAADNDKPIMGWSSWNTYHVNISDSLIMRQADALIRLGLKDAGYNHVNIDDGFFGHRDSQGTMHPHEGRFPRGMKPVADYIHSLGMKAGIYTDAGTNTCGSRYDNDRNGRGAGIYGHERQDARLYFRDWGFDFVKIDYCGAGQELELDEQKRYTEIARAIKAEANKDVAINICRWTFPGTWAADIAASWRISPDIRPRWSSVKNIIELNAYLAAYCHDGHFNDMDMLEIGRGLTASEEEVHFAMWCMMASPLLIGCDLEKIPASSLTLLKNSELIAIDQDPLCLQAYVAMRQGEGYVFVKDINEKYGNTRAVALYNPSDAPIDFCVPTSAIELGGKVKLRNLIAHKDLKPQANAIRLTVGPHAIAVLKAEGEERLEACRYEAEWGFMPKFDALGKRNKQILYAQNPDASGGMVVKNIGGESDNTLRWSNVYSRQGGHYKLTVNYVPAQRRRMTISINGKQTEIANISDEGAIDSLSLNIDLNPGENTIEIGSPYTWAPDIDRITLKPIATPAAEALTVEHRRQPVGIDVARPRFGWQIATADSGVVQTSYRIIVASSREKINANKGDIWDSGTVKSDSSQWVGYRGKALQPNREYFWKVAIATNKCGKAQWSDAEMWSTGMLDAHNWQGEWIGLDSLVNGDRNERHSRVVSRLLRKTFNCGGKVKRATLHISGLGLYTAAINGKHVGNSVMTPVGTDYNKTVAYDSYDITSLLADSNAIGVTLAGGHYFAQTQNYQPKVRTTYGMPKLRAMIVIEYANGKSETIATNSSWRISTDGPTRYANEYDGELYDSRLAKDFSLTRFDDSQWKAAQVVAAPKGELRGNITPPIRIYATSKPAKVKNYGERAILDFATNGAGRLCLAIKADEGDTIKIRHAETLDKSGKALYTDNLRAAEATAWFVGDGKEHLWHPDFTYYGFRYAEISVAKGKKIASIVDLSNANRQLIADDMSLDNNTISLSGDNRALLLNEIIANARRGIMSNYKGMPLDCPQRDERMPWLGDRTIGCTGESYIADCHDLYSKWTRDICDSQRNDGAISDVSPAYWQLYTDNVTWPAALPFAADMLYRQYGDLEPMRRCFEPIMKWLDGVKKNVRNGIVTRDKYGDWCVPPESPRLVHSKDPKRKTDGKLLSSTYYYYICRMMSRYARMFNREETANQLAAQADTTLAAINSEFLASGSYANGTATANLLPLAMGIVPDSCRRAVEASLVSTIVDQNNSHISCGVIGMGWIMRLLADIGRNDLAFTIATNNDYPSWGYMVEQGATTIWELWNGNTANPSMNSANHVMLLGDLLPWCFERLGGIRPDDNAPGFKHFHLQPDFAISSLDGIATSHQSPYGKIVSQWQRTPSGIEWRVEIPANTTATLHFPNGKTETVGSGAFVRTMSAPY